MKTGMEKCHDMYIKGEREDMMQDKQYICIDLKSFYASVECVERGLDPMTTDLVVADPSRSDKTICLAVSPALKAKGVKNRCRVFEIPRSMEYIMAPPRMQKYIDYAADIYDIYLRYISKDDIHVYSIDEVFKDVTPYLLAYGKNAKELTVMLMGLVFSELGIRATAGVGTNLYLAKIALDITAKHSPDFIGVLDEKSYTEKLWDHRPITDFWRIGKGTARNLESLGIYTMRQIAMMDDDILYNRFGIDAELMIDHAWGRETATIADIKKYQPKTTSLTSGQVLMRDYTFTEGGLVLREMTEQLCLDMTSKGLVTRSVTMYIGYSNKLNMAPARGTVFFPVATSTIGKIVPEVMRTYERIMDKSKNIRRFNISCNDLLPETDNMQITFFDIAGMENLEKDKKVQKAMLDIKSKFGKNAMFKGMDLQEAATALERNKQIGGHKSGE